MIACQWDCAFDFGYETSNELAWVVNDNKHGLINKKGEYIIPCSIDCTNFLQGGLSAFVDENGNVFDIQPDGSIVKRDEQ